MAGEYKKMKAGRKARNTRKFRNPHELATLVDDYFESITGIDEDGNEYYTHPPTLGGLSLFLGIHRRTLLNYEKQKTKEKYHSVIKEARERVLAYLEEHMLTSNKPTGAIFLAKNFGADSLSDKHEIDISADVRTRIAKFDNEAQDILAGITFRDDSENTGEDAE